MLRHLGGRTTSSLIRRQRQHRLDGLLAGALRPHALRRFVHGNRLVRNLLAEGVGERFGYVGQSNGNAASEHVLRIRVPRWALQHFRGHCSDVAGIDERNPSPFNGGLDLSVRTHRVGDVAQPVLHERVRPQDRPPHRGLG